jgi:hypothetical protein
VTRPRAWAPAIRGGCASIALACAGCATTLGIEEKHYEPPDAAGTDDASPIDPPGDSTPAVDASEPVRTPVAGESAADAAIADRSAPPSPAADATAPPPADASDPTPTPPIDSGGMRPSGSPPDADTAGSPDAGPSPPPGPPDAGPPNPLCGVPCHPANVINALCLATICTYDQCAPLPGGTGAFLDCDGDRTNGCEASPEAAATCGSCTNACRAGQACASNKDGTFTCKKGNANGN